MSALPPPAVLALPAAVIGLVMGSFVTALSYRQPRAQSVAHGRSQCTSCGHVLAAADLVPVLSWLAQGGACRYCRAPISWRYPAIECATMALFVAGVFFVTDPVRLVVFAAMTVVMVALAVVDLEQRRLPNGFLLVLAGLSLAWRWGEDRDLAAGVAAAVAVLAAGVVLNAGYKAVTGRAGLGLGDTKLLAVATLALPVGPLLLYLSLAGLFGVVFGLWWWWRRAAIQFPFGPAALAAYWAVLAGGPSIFSALAAHLA